MVKSITRKKGVSKIVVVVTAILIVVVSSTVLYYGTLLQSSTESPAPTQIATATPTNSPAQTFTPPPSQPPNGYFIQNFAAGKTATYQIELYNSTTGSIDDFNVNYTLAEGTYEGDPAWVWVEITRSVVDNVSRMYISEWKLNKTDFSALHLYSVQFINDTFSGDFETASVTEAETAIQRVYFSTYTGVETVTVPAGIFVDCNKAVSTIDTEIATTWVNPVVPFWGVVKEQVVDGDILTYSIELTAFG